MSKIFNDNRNYLMCPACGASFREKDLKSLICDNGHCFDFASKGYVNFIPNQKQVSESYSKSLFESRAIVFDAGVYDRVVAEIHNMAMSHFGTANQSVHDNTDFKINLLDVGCGEGYYAAKLSEDENINVFAIDIIKDAILTSCKRKVPVKWLVADLTKIPVRDNSVDVLLNILTSANYEEFKRVLNDDGIIIKIIPRSDYLKEIRNLVKTELRSAEYSNEKVIEHLEKNMKILEKRTLRYEFPVNEYLLNHFIKMTPMTAGIDLENHAEKILSIEIPHITIDLDVFVGKIY